MATRRGAPEERRASINMQLLTELGNARGCGIEGKKRVPLKKNSASAKPEKKRAQAMTSRVQSKASAGAIVKPAKKEAEPSLEDEVAAVLTSLKRLADKRVFEDMSDRYGVYTKKSVLACRWRNLQKVAKPLGRNHETRRRALGHRLVRGPYAGVVNRRAVASHFSTDGPRGFGTSTTGGYVTTVCFKLFEPHAAPPGARSRSGASRRRSSSNARALRCCGPSLCMTSSPSMSSSDRAWYSSCARLMRASLRQEGREHGAALRSQTQSALNAAAVTVARRPGRLTKCRGAVGGEGRAEELTSPGVIRRLATRRDAKG